MDIQADKGADRALDKEPDRDHLDLQEDTWDILADKEADFEDIQDNVDKRAFVDKAAVVAIQELVPFPVVDFELEADFGEFDYFQAGLRKGHDFELQTVENSLELEMMGAFVSVLVDLAEKRADQVLVACIDFEDLEFLAEDY